MKNRIQLFKENTLLGGYTLTVRDDWVYKLKYVHISQREKDEYEKTFGLEIITYNVFFEWWCKINKYGKYAEK